MTAEDYYKLGNEHRRKGDWKHALDCYLEAIALDPDSPAVEAKQMLDDILAYRCTDMYNPYSNTLLTLKQNEKLWEKLKVSSWSIPTGARGAPFAWWLAQKM